MSVTAIIKKIFSLLATLRNPYFFLYRLCHYLNRDVPYGIAASIYKNNKKDYRKNGAFDFLIDTYDGSGQAVHPDIVFYQNRYWLTVTPYPYGMEEYENPCIYQGDDLYHLIAPKGPVATRHKHTQGVHLSDPCFTVNGDNFFCFYRESERKGDLEEHIIWSLQYSASDNSFGKPNMLLDSKDDKILSPAMLCDEEGALIIYYVSSFNEKYNLVSIKVHEGKRQFKEYNIIGMPLGYNLWHIGITKIKDIYSNKYNTKELAGLFLMKSKQKGGGMKLFETRNDGNGKDWHVIKEIEMPDIIKGIAQFPYKSCFIPKSDGKILLSFRDKKDRNRMIILNNN